MDPIAYTAQIVAAKRAIEQTLPHPLGQDPYAGPLAGHEVNHLLAKWQRVADQQGRSLQDVILKRTRYIAIRTYFFDHLLTTTLPRLSNPQVVILGSGLDTRAYRLAWPPSTHCYEVDLPTVLDYKTDLLQQVNPTCHHHPIAGDLDQPQSGWIRRLRADGLSPDTPTFWLLEGVLMYLSEATVHSLLQQFSL